MRDHGLAMLFACLLAGCATGTGPAKPIDSVMTSSDCVARWNRIKGIEQHWAPGGQIYYIHYRDNLLHAWEAIGDTYFQGCSEAGIPPDANRALSWYQAAANVHVASAQYKLGKMIYEGQGTGVDRKLGTSWLVSGAIEGSSDARSYLPTLGVEVPPAISPTSYEIYREAARQDLVNAQGEERSRIMRDLGGMASQAVQLLAVGVIAGASASAIQPQQTYTIINTKRPVYCTAFLNAQQFGATVLANVSAMCQ